MKKLLSILLTTMLVAACGGPKIDETPVVLGANYVGVSVSDLEKSSRFYQAATDLQSVDSETLKNSSALNKLAARDGVIAKTNMLRTVNAQILLMQFDQNADGWSAAQVQGPGIAHICHQAAQTTDIYAKFLAGGGNTIGDPDLVQLSSRNPVYYGYVHDPDDNIIEIEEVDVPALGLDTPPKNEYRIRHVALATPDLDRLVKFYSVLLSEPKPRYIGRLGGFSGEKIDAVSGLPGSKLKMAWFKIRNLELEIAQYVSHPTSIPDAVRPVDALGYNMIVLDVTSLDEAVARFEKAGGTIETAVQTDFYGGPIIFGRDPDGNLIGLQVAPESSVVSAKNFSGDGAG